MKTKPARKKASPARLQGGILAGTDFSDTAQRATEVAAALAARLGSHRGG